MAERAPITLGSPLPITPKKRVGEYTTLFAQFAPRSSADSATKLRRVSSQRALAAVSGHNDSKRGPRQQAPPVYTFSSGSESAEPPQARPMRKSAAYKRNSFDSDHQAEEPSATSEDELATLAKKPARAGRGSARIHAKSEELKMEKRKKEREQLDGLRRGTRDRKTRILESDTLPSPPSRRRLPAKKLDTARNRLREEIAQKTKAKANNFLVAHKDYFLPLLPPTNHVSKLLTTHDAQPIVPYEELKAQPEGVTAVMKPYQLSGLSYLAYLHNNGFSGILGDEMGLGKTLQTLSLFQHLEELDRKNGVESEELRPYLVMCPLSVLNSWVTEAERWVPGLRVLRFHGAASERARLKRVAQGIEDLKGNETAQSKKRKASRKAGLKVSRMPADHESSAYKIIVTTYETFAAEQSWFKSSFVWRYVVLDEGHKIKSSVTQISTALRNISAEYRLILTGTPLQNNLLEMWALLAWLYPDVFLDNTQSLFKESFDLNKGNVNRQTMDDARHLLELVMLRRMKDSPGVDLGLPQKEEILLYVPLTPMQRFWYTRLLTKVDNAMLSELFADGKSKEKTAIAKDREEDQLLQKVEKLQTARNADQGEWEETTQIMRQTMEKEQGNTEIKSAWQKLMNLVMQLRKCCSHPYLLPSVAPEPYYMGEHIIRASGKFIILEKLLRNMVFEQGKKVLIFSGFTRTLDYTEDLLSLISNQGERFKHLRFDGGTSRARRNLDIRLFNQRDSDYKVMLLSTRAGGLGINLTTAQDVIFLDEDWNPQITLQAEARAHRIGQTKKVTIYKLCTQGTVEEQMMGRIRKKLYLSAKITESMRNIHSEQAVAKVKEKTAGRPSMADDMPHMDTSQLKTLIRRGAQTLSHPDIDATEMVSWDLETMMEKCRDKPADASAPEALQSEADEEKWLSAMERVECAVFDGKRYQRQLEVKEAANILPDSITREDRRKGKNTTVMINGYAVSKESVGCADWEAVPTLAGKDLRLADVVREKRREFSHEELCLTCFEDAETGHMIECKSCPRSYHYDCLEPEYKSKVKGFSGFYCSQHNCCDCGKATTDAGGLIFRCRWCPQGFCEDCLDWDKTELIGENLPEFEIMDEAPAPGGFYIKCPGCVGSCEESEEQRAWVEGQEAFYKEQHDAWIQEREESQREVEKRDADAAVKKNKAAATANGQLQLSDSPKDSKAFNVVGDEDDVTSPPALTDTSLPTPALNGSRVGTPKLDVQPVKSKKRAAGSDVYVMSRQEKKARLEAQAWSFGEDPLVRE
jgi:SWI/SNF-related matrix-associated actin-dependent regulator of chromatin subfamily A member 5